MIKRARESRGNGSQVGSAHGLGALPEMSSPEWWRRLVLVVAWLAVLAMLGGSVAVATGPDGSVAVEVAAALNGVGAIALLARRRSPIAVLGVEVAVAASTTLLTATFPHRGSDLLLVFAMYLLATRCSPRQAITAAIGSGIVIGAATCLQDAPLLQDLGGLVSEVAFLTAALAIGISIRSQRSLLQSLRDRAEQAEREQRWGSARAVAAERVRLARELHDVVAHHVSLLVVQAGAVRESLPTDHVTRPVLDSMVDGGRRAMAELRDMLGALRIDDQSETADQAESDPRSTRRPRTARAGLAEAPLTPQPTVQQLPDLVAGARAAGLPVTLCTEGTERALSPIVSLSVYRLVQEALTNAIKHAPGAFTTASIAYSTDALEVIVRNGPSPSAPMSPVLDRPGSLPAGHGLTGMAERTALSHGTLAFGRSGDGWEVRARFPIAGDAATIAEPPPGRSLISDSPL
jgi:signal transduction histidine kinase